MQEYNNTDSYPDSVRAARIKVKWMKFDDIFKWLSPLLRIHDHNLINYLQVNNIPNGVCDYLYGRNVDSTGKFCAGGSVDACQVK